jgi:hypothetical protein
MINSIMLSEPFGSVEIDTTNRKINVVSNEKLSVGLIGQLIEAVSRETSAGTTEVENDFSVKFNLLKK